MRPVPQTLTSPYAFRVEVGPCGVEHHRGCYTLVHCPALTPDGVMLTSLAQTYECLAPAEMLDLLDVFTDALQ